MIDLRKPLLAAILCALMAVLPAWAQTYKDSGGTVVPGVVPIPATVGGTASLSVTTASGTVPIPASDTLYPSINLTNAGTNALYYALGATATTSSAYLGAGSSACIAAGSATTVAAITASSTTTLQVTQTNSCLVGLNSGGGGGGGGGSGTVTSVATSCGVSGGPITTSGTISGAVTPNDVATGSAYAFLASDCGKLVRFTDSTSRAPTLNVALFSQGNFINIKNDGTGTQTITPSAGTINGAASLAVVPGASYSIAYDATNTNWIISITYGSGVPTALSNAVNGTGGFVTWGTTQPSPLTVGTGGSVTTSQGYYICTTTCSITLPTPVAGMQFCVRNDSTVTTVITISAITSVQFEKTTFNGYGTVTTGTMVSAGALGDKICLVGRDATHYLVGSFLGTWTNS